MPTTRQRHPKPPTNLIQRDAETKTVYAMDDEFHWTLHPTRGWRRHRVGYTDALPAAKLSDLAKWFVGLGMKKGFA